MIDYRDSHSGVTLQHGLHSTGPGAPVVPSSRVGVITELSVLWKKKLDMTNIPVPYLSFALESH